MEDHAVYIDDNGFIHDILFFDADAVAGGFQQ